MYGYGYSQFFRVKEKSVPSENSPINIVAPSLPDGSIVRATITCDPGEWIDIKYEPTFLWYRNDKVIDGEIRSDLFIDPDWMASYIYCEVTYCNDYGCTSVNSNQCYIADI